MSEWIQKLSAHTFKIGHLPYSRIGHRAILIDSNIIVIGGTNFHHQVVTDILNISCQSYEASLLITKNSVPIESFSLHSYNDKIYLWGGKRTSGGHTFVSNQLWKLQNGLFTKIPQKGQTPSPRFCHCSVLFAKKYMVIYGGISETQVFNDWYCMDLQTFQWKKINSDFNIPHNLESKIVWLQTRGVIFVTQKWNEVGQSIQYCLDLYEFSLRKKQNNLQVQIQKIDIEFKQKMIFRGFPTICKYSGDSLSVAIMGGQRFQEEDEEEGIQMFSDCWILNMDTYECSKADFVNLTAKYGHEAIFYKDRILLIGGVSSLQEFTSTLQTVDFKLKEISIDRKLCQSCKCIYGLEDFAKPKLSVKCEYDSSPKSFISAQLVKKFSETIRNPIKAFGLLIDNCLNMNANSIDLELRRVKLDEKVFKNGQELVLQIRDNSYGFTKEEILESLFTFGFKVETFTHDSKFEEQLAVRKEYGLNLKLASMRLGKSCLVVINTINTIGLNNIEDGKFIGYFSIDSEKCPSFKDRFNCFYYFINNQNNVSSELHRHIIRQNISHVYRLEQLEAIQPSCNKVIIFDFNYRNQFTLSQDSSNLVCEGFQDQGTLFDNLRSYLQSLYLKPYFGRNITINKKVINCQSLIQKYRDQEHRGKIRKMDLFRWEEVSCSFQLCFLYDVIDSENCHVIMYSENRLVCSMQFEAQRVCGVIELKPDMEISIGKCSIESKIEQRQLRKFITQLKHFNSNKTNSKIITDNNKKDIKRDSSKLQMKRDIHKVELKRDISKLQIKRVQEQVQSRRIKKVKQNQC